MIKRLRRGKDHQAVTPAIATMVLVSATLVLALIFGAYSYGMFGANVKEVLLTSVALYDGLAGNNLTTTATSFMVLTLRNPGLATNITSLSLQESGLRTPITVWSLTPGAARGNSLFSNGLNTVAGGKSTSFTIYPIGVSSSSSVAILTGQTYDYIISFGNGQSISSSLVAE